MNFLKLIQERDLVLKRQIELRVEVARAIRARREARALIEAAREVSDRLSLKGGEPKA